MDHYSVHYIVPKVQGLEASVHHLLWGILRLLKVYGIYFEKVTLGSYWAD